MNASQSDTIRQDATFRLFQSYVQKQTIHLSFASWVVQNAGSQLCIRFILSYFILYKEDSSSN